jgi:hypothetical protein
MALYTATLTHHSIARARVIVIDGSLTDAKRAAAREFSDEQRDYRIAVYEEMGEQNIPYLVATRLVGGRKWQEEA